MDGNTGCFKNSKRGGAFHRPQISPCISMLSQTFQLAASESQASGMPFEVYTRDFLFVEYSRGCT